jgi:hypothetical protein
MLEKDNLLQLTKVILFFLKKEEKHWLYWTKLNRYLFLSQFLFYKKYNKQLFNGTFIKDYFAPCLVNMETLLDVLEESEILEIEQTIYGSVIHAKIYVNSKGYAENELNVLRTIHSNFKNYDSVDIMDILNKEECLKNIKFQNTIPLYVAEKLECLRYL